MLATLKKYSPQERAGILASFAEHYLPSPGIDDLSTKAQLDPEVYKAIQAQIYKELSITADQEDKFRRRILDYISNEFKRLALSNDQIADIRGRVGQKGLLTPNQYEIIFGAQFIELNETLGVSRASVSQAISNPDHYEHLAPEQFPPDEENSISLFVKSTALKNQTPSTLLVLTAREKARLRVEGAWIVFHDCVDMRGAYSPSELLKRFLAVYGLDIKVGNQRSRFVLYEEMSIPKDGKGQLTLEIVERPKVGAVDARLNYRTSNGILIVGIAFAIHVEPYAKDLIKHGIKITRKRDPAS